MGERGVADSREGGWSMSREGGGQWEGGGWLMRGRGVVDGREEGGR